MKITVLFVVFGLVLTWLEPTESLLDAKEKVRIPPTITPYFPAKYYMPSPGKVPFLCEPYTGIPKPDVFWRYFINGESPRRLYHTKNGDQSVNGTRLIINRFNSDHQYQCVAKNDYGTALSSKIRIFQAKSATFDRIKKTKPFSYTSEVGESLSIPCVSSTLAIPANAYSWKYKDDGDDDDDSAIAMEDRKFVSENGSLVFSFLKKSDGNKVYICYIENTDMNTLTYGSWTHLDVNGGEKVPESGAHLLYQTPNNTVAMYLTKRFKVQCIFGGNPVPGVSWAMPLSNQLSNRFEKNKENNELIIKTVGEKDEGFYTCTSILKLGQALTASFYIDVKSAPIWVEKPKSLLVAEGQSGVFHCKARSLAGEKPLAKPKWYKNGVSLGIQPGEIKGQTHLSADGTTITIHNAKKSTDICNYQCSVLNDEGEIFGDAAFNVVLNTKVLVAPQSQTIEKGDVAMFHIDAETDPLKERYLKYTWILNGRKIEFLDLFDIILLPNNTLVINTTGIDENRFQTILGNYSVNITNEVETVIKYASLMGNPVKNPVISKAGMDLRWIALIVAVVLLFIIFILLLCVLFNRHGGDDYSVDKKERKAGHDPEKELADSGFHDLPRTDDDPDKQKPDNVSISSAAKSMGSETDSMEEYSDADAGSRFNEDGSFIGAYQGHESKGNVSNV